MRNLILLSAISRWRNVKQMADSIAEAFSQYRGDVKPTWLLCNDPYNATDQNLIDETLGYIWNLKMDYQYVDSGKPGQKNYGGDMYTEPLKAIKNKRFANDDPWVLVFDDDNIVHRLMASELKEMFDAADRHDKKVIWMTRVGCTSGLIYKSSRQYSFSKTEDQMYYDWCGLPDPSSLIWRYSYLESLGFFDTGYGYDGKIWWDLAHDKKNTLFPEEWHGGGAFYDAVQCTHNGINDTKRFIEIERDMFSGENEQKPKISNVYFSNRDKAAAFVIPEELQKEMFTMLKKWYTDKGYIDKYSNDDLKDA